MRVSEDPGKLSSMSWVLFSSEFPQLLSTGKGIKFIFVELRDDQTVPEISPVLSAGINYTGEIITTTTSSSSLSSSSGFESGTLFIALTCLVTVTVISRRKQRLR